MALILQSLSPLFLQSDKSKSPLRGLVWDSTFSRCIGLRIYFPARRNHVSQGRISDTPAFTQILCEKQQGTIPNVGTVTEQTWRKLVLESEIPVLVDFSAPWCGPCRMITSTVNELAEQYAGRLTCFILNTDDCPNLATEYGVRSIPTIMIFKGGEKRDAIIGAVPKNTLITAVEKYVDS